MNSQANIPNGLPLFATVQQLQKRAYAVYDPLWNSGLCSQLYAKQWLSDLLDIPFDRAIISWLNREQLITLILECPKQVEILQRRKAKHDAKKHKQHIRQQQAYNRRKY